MERYRTSIIAAHVALLLALPFAKPARAATFDGSWSIQIASPSSECGNGATFSIGISDGQIASSEATVRASGRVADAGNINVTLVSGVKRAVGIGHLEGSRGSGTWHGAICSGTWTAERI